MLSALSNPSKGLLLLLGLGLGATLLGPGPEPLGVTSLERDLVSGDARERRLAALTLSTRRVDASLAAEALVEALWDRDESVRTAARHSLGRLGPHALPPLLAALEAEDLPRRRPRCARALGELSPETCRAPAVRAALLAAADDPDPLLRLRAVEALGKLPTDDATADAFERRRLAGALLLDPSGPVRHAAALALERRGHVEALPALVRSLARDDNSAVRHAAATALGRLGALLVEADPEAHGAGEVMESLPRTLAAELARALEADEDEFVRAAAARAIGRVAHVGPPPEARMALSAALDDESERVRVAAAEALKADG